MTLLLNELEYRIMILLLTLLIGCDNVIQKHFKSSSGWFELDYPTHWTQFDEDDGTYLFMDNEDWKGNLRITAMRIENDNEPGRIKRNLREEFERKAGSKMISSATWKPFTGQRKWKKMETRYSSTTGQQETEVHY